MSGSPRLVPVGLKVASRGIRALPTGMLLLSLLCPISAFGRTLDEAVDLLGERLGAQIQNQTVSSLTILQLTNLSGSQGRREGNLADALARSISRHSGLAFISRQRADGMAIQLGLSPGEQAYGQTAARIGKGVGADAVVTGTIEEIGGGQVRLQGQVFSSQNGVNLASFETTGGVSAAFAQTPAPTPIPVPKPRAPEPRPAPSPPPAPRAVTPPATPTPPPTAVVSEGPVVTMLGLRVQVRYCVLSPSRTATCHMTVISESQDRDLSVLDNYTKIQDDTAKSYPAKLGFGRDAMNGQKKSVLVADTPYEITIHAENLSSQATRIIAVQVDRMDVRDATGAWLGHLKQIFPNPPAQAVAFTVPPALPASGARESLGFVFDVKSCNVAATRTMTCHLKVTSRGVSRKLTVLDKYVRLQDDTSRSYPAQLGWGMDARGGQNDMILIPDTPYDLTMIVENVSTSATRVRAIAIDRMDARQADGAWIGHVKMVLGHPPRS